MLIMASFALLESWEYFIAVKSHVLEEHGDLIV